MNAKKIVGVLAGLTVASSGLVAFNTEPASADGFGHNAVIKASGSYLWACHVLGGWKQSNFYCTDSYRYLSDGKNTKSAFKWSDSDAIWIPSGVRLAYRDATPDRNGKYHYKVIDKGGSNGKVHKVGGCFGCTKVYRYYF